MNNSKNTTRSLNRFYHREVDPRYPTPKGTSKAIASRVLRRRLSRELNNIAND